jgi:hypothetical protein
MAWDVMILMKIETFGPWNGNEQSECRIKGSKKFTGVFTSTIKFCACINCCSHPVHLYGAGTLWLKKVSIAYCADIFREGKKELMVKYWV